MDTKAALLAELRGAIARELEVAKRAQKETQDAATHPEAKPENDKDTRALELSYLARGQSQRVLDLDRALAQLSAMPPRSFRGGVPVALGALVEIETDAGAHKYLLAPGGGGMKLRAGDDEVTVVTPESPLGRALVGKCEGEEVEIVVAGKKREATIVSAE